MRVLAKSCYNATPLSLYNLIIVYICFPIKIYFLCFLSFNPSSLTLMFSQAAQKRGREDKGEEQAVLFRMLYKLVAVFQIFLQPKDMFWTVLI